jgi:uncharacterized protein YdeI (YjbR/CyaY-like superfamily)
MKTKSGEPIPDDLAAALESVPDMLMMWAKLRPSCQTDYVQLVVESKSDTTRKHHIERVLKMTEDYYRRHQKV